MTAPQRSHLDPDMVALLDDVRRRLHGLFNVGDEGIALAVSGTGSSGLETAIANVVAPGDRVLSIVTGYFGERLAQVAERYGADVTRLTGEWGRAIDPEQVRTALEHGSCQVVTVVHAETSTGVLQPVRDVAALARAHGALVVVDAVTSLGAHPVDVDGWGLDVVYSCSQKGLGAPSGLAPIAFNAAARTRATSRSFYLDLPLLEGYWVKRGYHHTISTPLIYALHEALRVIDEEPMPSRAARHERVHGESLRLSGNSVSRCCPRKASVSGRSTPYASRRASPTRQRYAWPCAISTASRSAPAWDRSPARCGASASWAQAPRARTSDA